MTKTMNRPQQIWLLFCLCFALLAAGLGWLSVKALQLDRDQAAAQRQAEQARRQAEQQELLSSALWRIDSALTPLIVHEAIRPATAYDAFRPSPADQKNAKPVASALLKYVYPYVLLHFQVHSGNVWSSPQAPSRSSWSAAIAAGSSQQKINLSVQRLEQLQKLTNQTELLGLCPAETLPKLTPQQGGQEQVASAQSTVVQNSYQRGVPANSAGSQQTADTLAQNPRPQSRLANDLIKRSGALQNLAQSELIQQRDQQTPLPEKAMVIKEGISQGFWIGNELILARRVQLDTTEWVQGCWIDWKELQQTLLVEIEDLLPDAQLQPVIDDDDFEPSLMLATLPVKLVVPDPPHVGSIAGGVSPIPISLLIAWSCLILACGAVAFLLHGVVRLSERRAAFVSAVTHELRTPLTTFRLYGEMLSQDMVTDPADRKHYLNTICAEAERLTHLVENVLAYARLERVRHESRAETLDVAELLERMQLRLQDRASQAEMQWACEVPKEVADIRVRTDAVAVEQIVFNLVDNACKYACSSEDKRIHLTVDCTGADKISISIRDHGPGISFSGAKRLFRPFSKSADEAATSAPGVGLGLALSRRLAKELGGVLELTRLEGYGAVFVLTIPVASE